MAVTAAWTGLNSTAHAAISHAGVAGLTTVPTSHVITGLQFTSGAALQVDVAKDRVVVQPVTFSPTAGAAATCKVELSADNSTYTTLVTLTVPVGIVFAGTVRDATVHVPAGWYVRFTATNATLGQSNWW